MHQRKEKKNRKEPLKVQRDRVLMLVRNAASVDGPAEQAGMLEFSSRAVNPTTPV